MVITLIVLIFEVRENTDAVRAATFQAVADSITDMGLAMTADREVVRVYWGGVQGTLEDRLDQDHFWLLIISQLRRFENAFYQRDRMSPSQWEGLRMSLKALVTREGVVAWWDDNHLLFSADFQDLVDELQGTNESH